MKHILIKTFLFAFIFLTLASCEPDEQNLMDVDVNFKVTYGGEPLVMFEDYIFPTGDTILFSRFSFYLSDLKLSGNEEYQLKSLDYLNFTNVNSSVAKANEGITLRFTNVDKLDYDEISFKVGVNASENAKTPSDFSSDSPLSKAGEYWPGWNSYIFSRNEGQIKIGGETLDFSLHTGNNKALLTSTLPAPNFNKADKRKLEITIDLKDYFGNNPLYDIKTNPQIHSPSQEAQVLELVNNLGASIRYQIQ